MNTSALIMWLSSITIVTGFTIYYFMKVVKNPNVKEEHEGQHPENIKTFDAT